MQLFFGDAAVYSGSRSTFTQQLEADTLDSLNIDGQTVAHTVIFVTVAAHLFLWCDRQHTPIFSELPRPRRLSLAHPHTHADPQ